MKNNKFEQRLRTHMRESYLVLPNDLFIPFLTHVYKRCTDPLKTMPFLYLIPVAFIITLLLYVFFGYRITSLSTLLQYGF